jgi:hypothetical protein
MLYLSIAKWSLKSFPPLICWECTTCNLWIQNCMLGGQQSFVNHQHQDTGYVVPSQSQIQLQSQFLNNLLPPLLFPRPICLNHPELIL